MGFRDFMSGRYGMDNLGQFLMIVTAAMVILSIFFGTVFLIIAGALLVLDYYRMFSRNYTKRSEENQKYLQIKNSFLSFFKVGFMSIKDRQHKYYRCPRCKRTLRVPRGKGNISIHCPTCGTDFIKKT